MRSLLLSLAIGLPGIGVCACGEASKPVGPETRSASHPAIAPRNGSTTTTATGLVYDGDDGPIRFFGHRAGAADRLAIVNLLAHYYADAAREDGLMACSLMASLTREAVPEEYVELPAKHGRSCAATMFALFRQRHHELVRDSTTLEVIDVRVEGVRALVLLRFDGTPEPKHIPVHRDAGAWKIWEIFASHMP